MGYSLKTTWYDLLGKCKNVTEEHKNKHTTIFGRAKILNSEIVPDDAPTEHFQTSSRFFHRIW